MPRRADIRPREALLKATEKTVACEVFAVS